VSDNLDAAQALIDQVDVLTGRGEIELVTGQPTMTVDTAVRVVIARALIDIARSLQGAAEPPPETRKEGLIRFAIWILHNRDGEGEEENIVDKYLRTHPGP
jgi:hypothetical protein